MPLIMSSGFFMLILFGIVILLSWHGERTQCKRLTFIKSYSFHPAIKEKLKNKHPLLSEAHLELALTGLGDYFQLCNRAQGKMVSMPSQLVDDTWHEFLLFSREYADYCKQGLGSFLFHTPAEAMPTPTTAQEGIKRAWRLACDKEHIDPKKPNKLPLLFAIDAMANIDNGFIYKLDCTANLLDDREFCASSIGCGGGGCAGCGGGCGGCGGGCGG